MVVVDRYDGNAKKRNHSCQHVASERGHVRRKAAKPVPVGPLAHRFRVLSQMYAWDRLLGMWGSYHYPHKIDLGIRRRSP